MNAMKNIVLAIVIVMFTIPLEAQSAEGKGARLKLTIDDPKCEKALAGAGAGVLVPFATFFIKEGIGLLKGWLEERAKSYGAVYSATASDFLVKQCGSPKAPSYLPRLTGFDFAYGTISGDYVTSPSVELKATVEMHSEGRQHVFRILPTKLIFNDPVSKRGDKKDLVFTVIFDIPTAYNGNGKSSGTKLASTIPAFEGLKEGRGEIDISGVASDWFPVPQVNPNSAVMNEKFALPFSILVTATETDNGLGPKVYLELSSQLEKNQDKILQIILGEQKPDNNPSGDKKPGDKKPEN